MKCYKWGRGCAQKDTTKKKYLRTYKKIHLLNFMAIFWQTLKYMHICRTEKQYIANMIAKQACCMFMLNLVRLVLTHSSSPMVFPTVIFHSIPKIYLDNFTWQLMATLWLILQHSYLLSIASLLIS